MAEVGRRTFDPSSEVSAESSIELEVMVMSTSIWPRQTEGAVQARPRRWQASRITLVILQLFVGAGGIFGGWEMIRHPLNAFGVTPELIAGSPFDTYTRPGILLLVLVGVAPCLLALGLLARTPGALAVSGLFGIGLMAWIAVQWALLTERLWLQPVMFGIGAVIAAIATHAVRRGAGPLSLQ